MAQHGEAYASFGRYHLHRAAVAQNHSVVVLNRTAMVPFRTVIVRAYIFSVFNVFLLYFCRGCLSQ